MDNLKSSNILKAVCYIMIPILLIIIIVNSASIAILISNPNEIKQGVSYFQTEGFRERYMYELDLNCRNLFSGIYKDTKTSISNTEDKYYENYKEKDAELKMEILIEEITREEENYSVDNDIIIDYTKMHDYNSRDLEILIIKDNIAFTNIQKTVRTDTIEELIDYIVKKPYYWVYNKNEVITDIETMQYDEIAYDAYFTRMQEKGVRIYSCIRDENSNELIIEKTMYNMVSKTYKTGPVLILCSGILLLLIIWYLILSIGHKKNYEGIYTDWLDKISLEIIFIVATGLVSLEGVMFIQFTKLLQEFFTTSISLLLLMGIIIYITLTILTITLIRRIKAKIFWRNTLCYKVIKYIYKKSKEIKENILNHASINFKIITLIILIICISVFLLMMSIESPIFLLIFSIFCIFIINRILKYTNKMYELRETIQKIYNGQNDKKLNEEEFTGELKQVALELNDIAGGLSNAIEEGLKSERMKTELITNVSHDIKTPLTSIINYVDLLKKEDIQNETAREYLQILDNKSQRLKKLTEDLVEASKASSGNIKLNIEKLNLGELLKQVHGEFEDKFKEKGLEVIGNLPKEEIYINADSKYMYRVMENLFTNISKYALVNSRVYVDLIVNGEEGNKKAYIILKNISQDELNISADELMQRFVRGDSSRTTTGSGLGLSIAKSLVELQNGKFELHLDGDLFKVVIEF